jgi:hypothetical protein
MTLPSSCRPGALRTPGSAMKKARPPSTGQLRRSADTQQPQDRRGDPRCNAAPTSAMSLADGRFYQHRRVNPSPLNRGTATMPAAAGHHRATARLATAPASNDDPTRAIGQMQPLRPDSVGIPLQELPKGVPVDLRRPSMSAQDGKVWTSPVSVTDRHPGKPCQHSRSVWCDTNPGTPPAIPSKVSRLRRGIRVRPHRHKNVVMSRDRERQPNIIAHDDPEPKLPTAVGPRALLLQCIGNQSPKSAIRAHYVCPALGRSGRRRCRRHILFE